MRIKNILMSALLLAGSLTATAQETKTEIAYIPNWYVGAQIGGQYTLGEVSFGDLISPNAQVQVGYNFNPVWGVRLGVNAWQSKGGIKSGLQNTDANWKYKYVAPGIDATLNLSNLLCGFNPDRILNVGVFAGLGANIAFSNDDAIAVNGSGYYKDALTHCWDGTQLNLNGRFGATLDFKVAEKVSLGVELQANALNDHYNSKHANNADWYFNALAGVKVNLGPTYSKKVTVIPAPEPIVVEKIVEKIVEKKVPVEVETREVKLAYEPLRVDIFFTICSTKLTTAEALKVQEVVNFLNKHPEAKVEVTGYADKGTGKPEGNMRLSEKRTTIVVDALKKAGIKDSRIIPDSKGDTVQPFDINDLNRVTICIAQ